jgi:hypothetical protein
MRRELRAMFKAGEALRLQAFSIYPQFSKPAFAFFF